MSPLKKKKLKFIRYELDKLDNSLLKSIKKRTNIFKKVLVIKNKQSKSNEWRKHNPGPDCPNGRIRSGKEIMKQG